MRRTGLAFVLFLVAACGDDATGPLDATANPDAGFSDAQGPQDATAPRDAALPRDAADTTQDAQVIADASDGGMAQIDATSPDADPVDMGAVDSGSPDSGGVPIDAGVPDATTVTCPNYPPQSGVSDAPLPEVTAGRSEMTNVDGFGDEYLYDAAELIKIGVRREWGGSIIFFGLDDGNAGLNATNAIDANDTGREVQVAIYDPDRASQNCAYNASCQSTPSSCPASITFLGWNPVQGGNRCNNGSGIVSLTNTNGLLSVQTQPFHWNPDWDRTDCDSSGCQDPNLAYRTSDVLLTQSLRFVRQHIVELRYTVQNLAAIDHAATLQEMPTLYAGNGNNGPNLLRLMDADGNEVAIDQPANDGFFFKNFSSSKPWATLQDAGLTYGVGIFYENGQTDFQGWQGSSPAFNNVRARVVFGLSANGVVHARAYLILGSFATVAAEAAWLESNLAPFGSLDAPVESATVSGATSISGWALDNDAVTNVIARVDESIDVSMTYGTARPDVCLAWPGYSACDAVGFSGSFDFSTLAPSCQHLLEIIATDSEGNQRTIARRRVYVGP